jgi:hypothetical protein
VKNNKALLRAIKDLEEVAKDRHGDAADDSFPDSLLLVAKAARERLAQLRSVTPRDPVGAVHAFLATLQELNTDELNAALSELERRTLIEARRDGWLYAELSGPSRTVQHMRASDRDHGVSLQLAGKDLAWAWRGDYWSALESALNQANVP